MDVIHIERSLFERLESDIRNLASLCSPGNDKCLGEWLDSQDVCLMLNISKRKLQFYRLSEMLPYSHIGNKVYHKPEDVKKLMPHSQQADDNMTDFDGSLTMEHQRIRSLFTALDLILKFPDNLTGRPKETLGGERYLTDRELSQKLNISKRTLQEYRDGGIIPYYRLCGKILYRESDLQQLLERNYRVGYGN